MRRIATLLGLSAVLLMAPSAGAAAPDFYPLPAGYTISNFGVASDGDGNMWFGVAGTPHATSGGSEDTPTLARVKPGETAVGTSNGMAFFPTPDRPDIGCCSNQLRSIAYNKDDGKLYYVHSTGGYGAVLPSTLVPGTSTGMVTQGLPGYTDIWDVTAAKGGGAWFTEQSTSNVGPTFYGARLAFFNGSLTEGPNIAVQNGNTSINSQRYDAKPAGVTTDANGAPWFVEEDLGLPGYRIATWAGAAANSYSEYLITPCVQPPPGQCSGQSSGTGLTDVAYGADGGLWFTNAYGSRFGRFDPATQTVTQYSVASVDPSLAAGTPRQIVAAPDGTLWMTVYKLFSDANALVRIVPGANGAAPTATFTKTGSNSAPLGIGASTTDIWFGATDNRLGRLAGVVGAGTAPPATGGGSGGGNAGGGAPSGGGAPPTAPPATTPAAAKPPVVLTPVSVGTTKLDPPQTGNGEINTNQICVGPAQARCSIVYLVREHEYVTGFPSSLKAKKKPKARTLATKSVVLHGGQKARITIKLNKLGQRILKKKGSVKVDVIASEKLAGGKTRVLTRKTLTVRRAAKRHH